MDRPARAERAGVRRGAPRARDELAVEDAIKAHQRPKLEIYGETLFVVLKPATYHDDRDEIELGETLLFVGDGFIVSVRHAEATALAEVRRAVESEPERLRCGPDAVLHAIVDRVVDDYLPVAQALEEDIEEVEAGVFSPERSNRADGSSSSSARCSSSPGRPARSSNPSTGSGRPSPGRRLDELLLPRRARPPRAGVDQVENERELLTSILTANLSQVGVRQSEDMPKISAWVVIVAVPTTIAGVYGMNFEHMPELRWTFGYPLVVAIMVTICALLYRRFRRSGWL